MFTAPVKVTVPPDPASVALVSNKHQVDQSYEEDHKADEEQLSKGRYQKPRENLG